MVLVRLAKAASAPGSRNAQAKVFRARGHVRDRNMMNEEKAASMRGKESAHAPVEDDEEA
jgi:hypothetical protein